MKDLCTLSVDEGKHLSTVDKGMHVEELSYLCFGRTDWGLLVSCFACLWHELIKLVTKTPKKWGDIGEYRALVASEPFAAYVRTQNTKNDGLTSVPVNLVSGYVRDVGNPNKRALKRRPSDVL